MLLLQFLVIFAIVVASLIYFPQNRKNTLLGAVVIAVLFIVVNVNKDGFNVLSVKNPVKVKVKSPSTDNTELKAASDAINISDALTIYTLPQVDILGRNIDDKMAMNQTASRVVVPGGINAVFEHNVSDRAVQVPEPSSGPLTGSPLF